MGRLGFLLFIGLRDVLTLFTTDSNMKVSRYFLVYVTRGDQQGTRYFATLYSKLRVLYRVLRLRWAVHNIS